MMTHSHPMFCYEPTPRTELTLTGTKGSLSSPPRPTNHQTLWVGADHERTDVLTNTGNTLNPKLLLNLEKDGMNQSKVPVSLLVSRTESIKNLSTFNHLMQELNNDLHFYPKEGATSLCEFHRQKGQKKRTFSTVFFPFLSSPWSFLIFLPHKQYSRKQQQLKVVDKGNMNRFSWLSGCDRVEERERETQSEGLRGRNESER